MPAQPENQSASQRPGEGSAPETESERSQREAFERLCEKIKHAMCGGRPPEHCMPPEWCAPPFGHHYRHCEPWHHYCGPPQHYCEPPHHYCGPPPPLSLLNHMFQFAGARAHFWHRWFESLAGTAYRSQPSHYWHDPCWHGHWHDPCHHKHDSCCHKYDPRCAMPDCDEFKDMKSALKDFLSHLDEAQKQKYEPVVSEMIHCVSMMRRMDAMRRKPYGHWKPMSAGPGWN
jgi:hypothetical protein